MRDIRQVLREAGSYGQRILLCHGEKLPERVSPPATSETGANQVDIITAFAFGECWDMLDEPGFESEWLDSTHALAEIAQISIHFPFVRVLGQIVGNIFPKTLPIAFIKAQMVSRGPCLDIAVADSEINRLATSWHAGPLRRLRPPKLRVVLIPLRGRRPSTKLSSALRTTRSMFGSGNGTWPRKRRSFSTPGRTRRPT